MSKASGCVAVLCVVSVHGVPMLIRCVGGCAPPRREMVGILNAVYQSVRQETLGPTAAGSGGDGGGRASGHSTEALMQLQELRTADSRVTFRSYAPAGLLLVLVQNGGATYGAGSAVATLDMCYQAIVLLNGEHEGVRSAKDNPQSFQRRLRSITYYLDTIVGGDALMYASPSAGGGGAGAGGGAGGGASPGGRVALDCLSRASTACVTSAVRAPSAILVPYSAASKLRGVLTAWVNRYGAFAAALVAGPSGALICTADPHVSAATEEWCEQTTPSQLAILQMLWAHHVSSGKVRRRAFLDFCGERRRGRGD
jgi:hypothetical protein